MDDESDDVARRSAAVWAKSWPRDGSEVEWWLPLWRHLDDAADVAGLLWDSWVPLSTRRLVERALGGSADDARRLATWLAGVHDVGKATPAFAVQVPRLSDRMVREGLRHSATVRTDRTKLRHEVAGAAILDRWLAAHSVLDRFDRGQLTGVVAGHHGLYPVERQVRDARLLTYLIGDERWQQVQESLLDRAAARAGLDLSEPRWADLRLPQAVQTLLTGVVVMADWIASGDDVDLFPVDVVPEVPPPVPGPDERISRAWARVALGRRWTPRSPATDDTARFAARFPAVGGPPRPVQALVAELARTMAAPGLMILEAGVGVGKTEAALLAVETLAARCGSSGCLLALPTQATSNAMFDRMLRWLELLPDGDGVGTQSVGLAHGKAALNDEMRQLRFGQWRSGAIFEDDERTVPVVVQWTLGRRRSALSNFVVATVDQVLFAALRARYTTLRHLALAGKVVVVDEVHAADVYMSAFLERALEWLAASGAPVVLMSATLPAERRIALYLAYERGRRRWLGQEADDPEAEAMVAARLSGDIGYPSVVVTSDEGPSVATLATGPSDDEGRPVLLRRLDDDLGALGALLEERLADGGCAVVIRNTVRRAQETGRYLTEQFGSSEVTVCHAGFLAVDRVAKDAELLRRFGPPGPSTKRPPKAIVVATQVVEQSLDVDFDLMVTDVAPADLVVQRLGRLHRHGRGADRPVRLRDATCFVTGVDWSGPVPGIDSGARAVYGSWLLLCSLAVLGEHLDGRPVRLPDDIARIVQAAYDDGIVMPEPWRERADEARARFASSEAERRQRAESFGMAPVLADGTPLYGAGKFGVGSVDEDDPKGQACVRDSGDSLEVVVLQRRAGVDRIPDWVGCDDRFLPLPEQPVAGPQARMLARCTLRLPYALTVPRVIDAVLTDLLRTEFPGWDGTPLLKGQIPLVLDDERRTVLAGHDVRYDERYGLVVDGPEDDADDTQ